MLEPSQTRLSTELGTHTHTLCKHSQTHYITLIHKCSMHGLMCRSAYLIQVFDLFYRTHRTRCTRSKHFLQLHTYTEHNTLHYSHTPSILHYPATVTQQFSHSGAHRGTESVYTIAYDKCSNDSACPPYQL